MGDLVQEHLYRAMLNEMARKDGGLSVAVDELVKMKGKKAVLLDLSTHDEDGDGKIDEHFIRRLHEVMQPKRLAENDLGLMDVLRIRSRQFWLQKVLPWWKDTGEDEVERMAKEIVAELITNFVRK